MVLEHCPKEHQILCSSDTNIIVYDPWQRAATSSEHAPNDAKIISCVLYVFNILLRCRSGVRNKYIKMHRLLRDKSKATVVYLLLADKHCSLQQAGCVSVSCLHGANTALYCRPVDYYLAVNC